MPDSPTEQEESPTEDQPMDFPMTKGGVTNPEDTQLPVQSERGVTNSSEDTPDQGCENIEENETKGHRASKPKTLHI